jgi:hypothetical protein
MILVLLRILFVTTDGSSCAEELFDLRGLFVNLPLHLILRDLLLNLREVLIRESEGDPPALHLDDLFFDKGILKQVRVL